MKRLCRVLILVLPALMICGEAQEMESKEEMRERFIARFDRIGMNTAPEDAALLRMLVQSSSAVRGLEVGSANGYGAIHMGIGFERTGGELITVDIDADMVRQCRANVQAMQLEESVTCLEGDALELLPRLEGRFDFLFLDARKSDYMAYFRLMEPKMDPGSLIVADNVFSSRRAMQDFLSFMEESPDYEMVEVRASELKNDGMALIYRIR